MLLFIKNYHRGYVIGEVLIVLLLLGVLSSFAFGAYAHLINQHRAQQDILQLLSAIAFARSQALLLHTEVKLCPANDADPSCGSSWQNGIVILTCDPHSCQILRQFILYEPQATLTSTRPILQFSANGMTTGSNLTLFYRSKTTQCDFIINNNGRVRQEQSCAMK